MNDKISSYFPPPDKPKKPRRPKDHPIDRYDYGDTCNKKGCKNKIVVCPECLKEGVTRFAHRKVWLGNPRKRTDTHTEVFTVYTHGHFAYRKGTKAPLMSEARNTSCEKENSRRMIDIGENCDWCLKLKGRETRPEWLRRYLDGEDND